MEQLPLSVGARRLTLVFSDVLCVVDNDDGSITFIDDTWHQDISLSAEQAEKLRAWLNECKSVISNTTTTEGC